MREFAQRLRPSHCSQTSNPRRSAAGGARDADRRPRHVVPIARHRPDPLDHLHPCVDPTEDCVLAVEPRRRRKRDEELPPPHKRPQQEPSEQARGLGGWRVEGRTCEPLVLGPELAMERIPAPVCFSCFVISSSAQTNRMMHTIRRQQGVGGRAGQEKQARGGSRGGGYRICRRRSTSRPCASPTAA